LLLDGRAVPASADRKSWCPISARRRWSGWHLVRPWRPWHGATVSASRRSVA